MRYGVPSQLDLRVSSRTQNQIRDIADNRLKVISRRTRQLLPRRVIAKHLPPRIQLSHVREREHIGEVGHPRTDERVSVEDLPEPGALEYLELPMVEHLHLAHVVLAARALISTELEDALALFWSNQLRPAFKGNQQRALNPQKGRRS